MSIDQLADIDVSSVSKTAQPLSQAPAAISVITHDMIVRSGAATLPEILRLAPNLQVYRKSATDYAITARGMNGSVQAQNFSNKLLVLIDGRSVYTPLYSGVYWDMQDVLPGDIDRIEVISGPGATLWGANAVNGVINIITRDAAQTQGFSASGQAGARERSAGLRYGGGAGTTLAYRFYLRANDGDSSEMVDGASAEDDWHRLQAGFRADWTPDAADNISLHGDIYRGRHGQLGAPDETTHGGNFTARWTHKAANGNQLQVQAYVDHAARRTLDGGGHFWIDTYDLDVQHTLTPVAGDTLVWGGDLRASPYRITAAGALGFVPPARTLWLGSAFAQNTLALTDRLDLITGLKLEHDPYAGVSLLPDARLAWRVSDKTMVWGAVSRAVRSPTPFDTDVQEYLAGLLYLKASPDFRTEKLTAFELGTRLQPSSRLSLSISGYYNLYDDLRSIEPSATFLPLVWGNKLAGDTYGVEIWGTYQPFDWWTLSASLDLFGDDYHAKPGASELLGPSQIGSDPREQSSLGSSMTFGKVSVDAHLRHVAALPYSDVPAYTELDGQLAWAIGAHLALSLNAENLLHRSHVEYAGGYRVARQLRIGIACQF
ncbi:MAG: TonB-dependent receptor plug domain-containing protein [Sphingomonas sp.]